MRLLVSVRSADEVEDALAGGADIIDAKEPAHGPLGAVSPAALEEIAQAVPARYELSVALGDVISVAEVDSMIDGLELPARTGATYLKLGFSGVESPEQASQLLGAAVRRASLHRCPLSVVAVAYADAQRAATVPPEVVLLLAAAHGAAGVLMDTHVKDGTGLLDWRTPAALASWVTQGQSSGLLVALAGALKAEDAEAVGVVNPDIVGFRGAACDAGRLGTVSAERVALLRRCLDAAGRRVPGRSAYGEKEVAKRGICRRT